MIYLFDRISEISDAEYEAAFSLLSDERKKRTLRYRFRSDRLLSAFAYLLLMVGLDQEGHLSDVRPEFTTNRYGKPYLQPDVFQGVYFNLSHCEKGIVCGISEYELGVDVEAYVEEYAKVTDLVLHPGERGLFDNCVNAEALFTQLWTMKEAYTKMVGSGLSYEITELDFSGLFTRGAVHAGAQGASTDHMENAACVEAHRGTFHGAHLLTERREAYVVSVFSRGAAFSRIHSVSHEEMRRFIERMANRQFIN